MMPIAPPRRPRPVDDTGSLAMAMLLIIVAVGLSSLMLPQVVVQARSTRAAVGHVDSLNAAQTGLEVGLGHIRAAVTSGAGDEGKLPCGPFAGNVSGGAVAAYSVKINYF